jgi:hypothetical protein
MTELSNGAKPLQFSIRLLLVATAAVAAAVGAVTAKPSWKSLVALECLTMFLATGSLIVLRQATGNRRTFWIGVTVGHSMAIVCGGHVIPWFMPYQHGLDVSQIEDYAAGAAQSLRFILPAIWCAAPVNGLLCVVIHWLLWPGEPRPSESGR